MKRIYLMLLTVLLSIGWSFASKTKTDVFYRSPDKKVALQILNQQGRFYFKVFYKENLVVRQSPLGLETSLGSFGEELKQTRKNSEQVKYENYTQPIGKKSQISVAYREVQVYLKNAQSRAMDLIFRVSNDGVAYRYKLHGSGSCTINRELGGYRFPGNATAFMTPLSQAHTGFARTNPSYEEHYQQNIPVGTPSTLGCGWSYPALFNIPGAGWVLISETGTTGTYCGTHLAHLSTDSLYRIEFPNVAEGLPGQHSKAMMSLPYETPWRMMIVGDAPTAIAQSTMATDLVKPMYKAKGIYKPGKATWSWLVLKDDSITYDVTRKFIDLADTLNFDYCLIDAPWDVQIGRENISTLAVYADIKGVGLLLWYNSNGKWNDAPQTPKNCMDNQEIRRAEMKWMQSIGIKGIKVDFFGSDKQFFMQYYEDILKDANDFGLTVNFHGTTLPRGWERIYPNFVTDESVKGMEFVTFSQYDADREPQHCATLPFLRNVVGPMDFTPIILNERLGADRKSGPIRRTTMAFELALPVVFFSGVQHFGLIPENLSQLPAEVINYLKDIPTVWDETRFLAGYPGKDCVVARRSGKTWYVAGINGENVAKTLSFDTSTLSEKDLKGFLIQDQQDSNNAVVCGELPRTAETASSSTMEQISVKGNGGFVLIFNEIE
ncbi:MAG TPA: glycoside hydrolase family 97 catalytic domain-containing protein [Bacteroidales bacterium]|nr:glycoside hydrolase family 97 catalytic domain-containing protein [Bacteroidales bacterium]